MLFDALKHVGKTSPTPGESSLLVDHIRGHLHFEAPNAHIEEEEICSCHAKDTNTLVKLPVRTSWTTAFRRLWCFVGVAWGGGWGGACINVHVNLHMK